MYLNFRFPKIFVASLLKPRIGLFDKSELNFLVMPTDLDFNLHVNNARYLSFMDLGRTDLLLRVGMARVAYRERWRPVVGNINIRFRRSLLPFRHFTLQTRLLGWDEKWIYLEQRFESARGVHAVAMVQGVFVGRDGSVPSHIVLNRMGHQGDSPIFPAETHCLL